MLKSKGIDRICALVIVFAIAVTVLFINGEKLGIASTETVMGYESRLFDTSRVHTLDIVMNDWDAFLETCTNEEYVACTVVIDGEAQKNVGIRAKGNTSLSSVASYGNNRYSFKVEFDHYNIGGSYYGLDKLSLNNLIQDNTYLKDYFSYTLMRGAGAASPLCSFVQINVNGEPWGLYLAVEAIEDSFMQRNFGKNYGNLYKPDSMSMGANRGQGRNFNMTDFIGRYQQDDSEQSAGAQQMPEGFDPSAMFEQMLEGVDFSALIEQLPEDSELAAVLRRLSQGEDLATVLSQMPEGFDPFTLMAQLPEGFDPSALFGQTPGGAQQEPNPPEMANRTFFVRDGGGFGGMGSADVMLQYIDDSPDSYGNIFGNAKTNISTADQSRLIQSLKTLSEGEDVESVVDVEAVIRYFVAHNFLCNGDSYTGNMIHNYYLYEKDGVMTMLPWDYNLSLGGFAMGGFGLGANAGATGEVNSPIDSPVSSSDISSRPMVAWIFADETYTALYHQYYAEFIQQFFTNGEFGGILDSVVALISPYVQKDPTAFCTYEEFTKAVDTMRVFFALRAESVTGQLDGSIPSTTEGQSANSTALVDASSISVSDMGSMGGGMRGGWTRNSREPSQGGNRSPEPSGSMDNQSSPTDGEPNPLGGTLEIPDESSAQPWSLSSGNNPQQDAENIPSGFSPPDMASSDAAPQDILQAPETAGEVDAQNPANPQGAQENGDGLINPPDMQDMRGEMQGAGSGSPQQTSTDAWILLGVSVAILLGGLAFAFFYKRR